MKTFNFLAVLFFCFFANALQAQNIERLKITYDDNGNRLLRQYINALPDSVQVTAVDKQNKTLAETAALAAYPNEVGDVLVLQNNTQAAMQVQLYDVNGKQLELMSLTPGSNRISLSTYSPGYYFLNYTNKGVGNSIRLLKK